MKNNEVMSKKTADRDFVKIYRRYFSKYAALVKDNPRAFIVLWFLIQMMDGNNMICMSMGLISKYVALTRQSVSKYLSYLEERGWIQQFMQGRNRVYVINDMVAYTSYLINHKNCPFTNTLQFEYAYESAPEWIIKKSANKRFIKTITEKE